MLNQFPKDYNNILGRQKLSRRNREIVATKHCARAIVKRHFVQILVIVANIQQIIGLADYDIL